MSTATPAIPSIWARSTSDKSEMFFLCAATWSRTKGESDDNELIYDRAIYFGSHFTEPQ